MFHIPCLAQKLMATLTQLLYILGYPKPDGPFDTVAINRLQLPRSSPGLIYEQVCVDHFSRLVILAPLPNKSSPVVTHALVTHLPCP